MWKSIIIVKFVHVSSVTRTVSDCKELHEECGVVGFYGVEGAATHAFLALQSIQHRGQQGCGISVVRPGAPGCARRALTGTIPRICMTKMTINNI